MKKLFALVVMTILLSACGETIVLSGKIVDKDCQDPWTEEIPGEWRWVCDWDLDCEYKYVWPTTKYHSGYYHLTLSRNDELCVYNADKETYLKYKVGDIFEEYVDSFMLGECRLLEGK